MWKKFYDLAKLVLTYGQQLQRHQKTIEALEQEVKQLTTITQQMYFEMRRMQDEFRHVQDNEQHEREKLLLRLEIEILKFERRLPPGKSDEE